MPSGWGGGQPMREAFLAQVCVQVVSGTLVTQNDTGKFSCFFHQRLPAHFLVFTDILREYIISSGKQRNTKTEEPSVAGSENWLTHPSDFSSNISQTAELSHTCSYIFFAHVVHILDPCHSKSGHQVTSSDLTSEKVWMLAIATPTERLSWNFQQLISVAVSIKWLPRNFEIGDLRSGQFCVFSSIPKWMRENWKAPLLEENHLKHSQTLSYVKYKLR